MPQFRLKKRELILLILTESNKNLHKRVIYSQNFRNYDVSKFANWKCSFLKKNLDMPDEKPSQVLEVRVANKIVYVLFQ